MLGPACMPEMMEVLQSRSGGRLGDEVSLGSSRASRAFWRFWSRAEYLAKRRWSSFAASIRSFSISACTSFRKSRSSKASNGCSICFAGSRGKRSRCMDDLGKRSFITTHFSS